MVLKDSIVAFSRFALFLLLALLVRAELDVDYDRSLEGRVGEYEVIEVYSDFSHGQAQFDPKGGALSYDEAQAS